MTKSMRSTAFGLLTAALLSTPAFASSFICQEPGGKRLVRSTGRTSVSSARRLRLRIDGEDLRDRDGKRLFCVDDHDVRPEPAGVKLLTFDDDDLRHGAGGKVVMITNTPTSVLGRGESDLFDRRGCAQQAGN